MFGLGVQELLIILLIILIFFGAEKIPQLAKSIGKGMAEFRKASQEVKEEIAKEAETAAPTAEITENNTPVIKYITCNACQAKSTEGSIFCPQCGQRLSKETRCTVCQRTLGTDEKFCPNCGNSRPV